MNTYPPEVSTNQEEIVTYTGPLGWWHRIAAPPGLARTAPLAARERVRKGKLASTLTFYLILALLLVLPVGIFGSNHRIVPAVVVMLTLVIIALLFNRKGASNVTGLILGLGYDLAVFSVILLNPGGITPSMLGLFDMLVCSEIFFVSLLPTNWVFFSLLINSAFIVGDLLWGPHAQSFVLMMTTDRYAVILRPILLHVLVTLVLWLLVRSTQQAIARADHAEEIIELQRVIKQQKQQLEEGVERISGTLVEAANGNFNIRVPLNQDSMLWKIAHAVNTLLARLQSNKQDWSKLDGDVNKLAMVLHKIRHGARVPALPFIESHSLDPLAREIAYTYQWLLSLQGSRPSSPPQKTRKTSFQEPDSLF